MGDFQRIAEVCEQQAPAIASLLGDLGQRITFSQASESSLMTLSPNAPAGAGVTQLAALPAVEAIVGGLSAPEVGLKGLEPHAVDRDRVGQLTASIFGGMSRQPAMAMVA